MAKRNTQFLKIMAILMCYAPFQCHALECPQAPDNLAHDVRVETQGQLAKLGRLSGAEIKINTEVIAKSLLEKTPDMQARIYMGQMVAHMYCTLMRDSKEFNDREILKELNELEKRLQGYINKPANSDNDSKPKPADKHAGKGEKKASTKTATVKADNQRGSELLNEGRDFYFRSSNDDARQNYYQAQQLFIKTGNTTGQAQVNLYLGDLERMLGRNEEARAAYDKALPLYRAEQSRLGEADTLRGIGRLLKLENNPNADTYFRDALIIFKSIGMHKEASAAEGMLSKK